MEKLTEIEFQELKRIFPNYYPEAISDEILVRRCSPTKFGARLRQLRIDLGRDTPDSKGPTQTAIAKAIACSKQTISLYERGKCPRPSFDKCRKLADYFKCDLQYLLGYTPARDWSMSKADIYRLARTDDDESVKLLDKLKREVEEGQKSRPQSKPKSKQEQDIETERKELYDIIFNEHLMKPTVIEYYHKTRDIMVKEIVELAYRTDQAEFITNLYLVITKLPAAKAKVISNILKNALKLYGMEEFVDYNSN